jgi:metallo-beta-lactamase family protein
MPNLHFTPKTEESIAINERPGPAIIISASGMCTAGRIKHHLKHNLWRPGASIVIVGFQAGGTTGRQIVDGAESVKIFHEDVAVRAKVFTIGGFSAHADQKGLLEWISNFAESRPRVFIVHGEPTSSEILAGKIGENFGLETHIPHWKETLLLEPRAMKTEAMPEEEIPLDTSHYMMNTIADIERELKGLKRRMEKGMASGNIGEDELERLKKIQEEMQLLGPQ